ncbi:MAG TPA: hypothetical protein VFE62_01640 [Gemmataceae bacterium]|nr:hypothetical protein [Gemmataceae bacterium]
MTISAVPITVNTGRECYAYANSGNHGTPTWTLVDFIQDVKISDSDDKTELKLRANRPFKTAVPTLTGWNVTLKVPNIKGDPLLSALRTAKQNKTAIDMIFLDGVVAPGAGLTSQGPRADWMVEKMDDDQDTGNAEMLDVSLVPAQTANVPAVFSVVGE